MQEKRRGPISFVGLSVQPMRSMPLERHVILCVKSSLCCTACEHVKFFLTSLLFVVVSALSAPAVELFRYRVFYHVQVGTSESREFRTRPIPHWLFCFSETIEGPIQRMYFVVLLPNGMAVEPKFAQRL